MSNNKNEKWQFWAVGTIFLAVGLFNVANGIMTTYRIIKWSSTQGTIISSTLQTCSRGKSGRGLIPEIRYSYLVNKATYVQNQIEPLSYSACMRSNNAKAIASKYPMNSNTTVYFNSEQPIDAFIFGGKIGRWWDILMIIGGVLLIYFADSLSLIRKSS